MKSGLSIIKDASKKILESLKRLPGKDVLVGVPEDKTERKDGDPITNATLGFIHEFGAPDANIPARPHLVPGIREARNTITKYFKQAGSAALKGDPALELRCLHAAGVAAVSSVRNIIQAGIPPELSDATLKARAGRKSGKGHRINKGAQAELEARAKGTTIGIGIGEGTTPLIDTSQYLHSITYVVRENKE